MQKESKSRFSLFNKSIEFINSVKNNNPIEKSIEIDAVTAAAVLEEAINALALVKSQRQQL